MITINTILII